MREPRERLRTLRWSLGRIDQPLQLTPGAFDIAARDVLIRSQCEPAAGRGAIVRWRQVGGTLRKGGGRVGCATAGDGRCGILERGRHRGIRLGDGAGQMPRTLLTLGDHIGEPPMDVATPLLGRAPVRRGGEERMAEAQCLALALEHAGGLRPADRGSSPVAEGGAEQVDRRVRGRRCRQDDRLGLGVETCEPVGDEGIETRRDGERIGVGARRSASQRPTELQGVERVPARDGVEPDQGRPSELEPEPRAEEAVDGVDRQRPHVHACDPLWRRARDGGDRLAVVDRPPAGDQADRLVVESPKDEIEDPRRWLIEPLDVVDGEDQRSLASGPTDHVSHRHRDGERFRRTGRRDAQEGRLERHALWLREVGEALVGEIGEEVVQGGEG